MTRGEAIWLSDPPLTRTASGGRDTRVASALMFWSSVCRSGGTSARWLATHALLLRDVEIGAGAGLEAVA